MNLFFKYIYNLSTTGYCFNKILIEAIDVVLSNSDNDIRVLDFGCGEKPFGYMFDGCQHYLGVDVYAGKKVDVVYDGGALPFLDNYFDLIFSSSVLEHVDDLPYSLAEMSRVLKPTGVMLSVIPFMGHIHGTPHDYHRPTYYGWQRLLTRAGFENIEVKPVDNRFQCLCNIITSAINNSFYLFLKKLRSVFSSGNKQLDRGGGCGHLNRAATSAENSTKGLKIAYLVVKFNPINFILGLLGFFSSFIFKASVSTEGQITSGYLIKGTPKS